ncbi:ATP-dependent DNA helicase [Synoicihabitans lomoniglobus]|uniref:Helicase C-terminal domain-containing protein n=1 Tax=Synoicihabitans lomoniglobus TaxID=2909285 RepID=A0AAF0CQB7_9BACT|nr:helicase [Opitutaceae bacterium LMO-M01]WED66097.1 helicase C-terminal domain-containing protein [Opitutaceae bacterium LMO-M01]
MDFDLTARTARLSVGELADFAVGPRDGGEGQSGIWRAQLGSYWHRELQTQTTSENPDAHFEVAVDGEVAHRGWRISLNGRIDQLVPQGETTVLREIKTLTKAVPVPEPELRADYPHYFAQLAIYLSLRRLSAPESALRGELIFVEAGSGLSQTVRFTREDEAMFDARLERLTQFLDLHRRALERRRTLTFAPAFPELRPGQEDTRQQLETALTAQRVVAFEAPTGFGKTGVMLETALESLRSGSCDRVIYLTSKSTGQLQVVHTLQRMTDPAACHLIGDKRSQAEPTRLAVWHVRNKGEHCVNTTFHCVRDQCRFIQDVETRWPGSGLDRFHLFENEARDLPTLRAAGRDAGVCPYEITRTALAFQDVWVGDYNYVFAPRNRGLFENQPGWNPARTMLIIDEAHNLPSRVADAHSHRITAAEARAVLSELDHQRAPSSFQRAWESWTLLLSSLRATEALDAHAEDDVLDVLTRIADQLPTMPVDFAAMGPQLADTIWLTAELVDWLRSVTLTRLLWSPRDTELNFTCLDAAPVTGSILRTFGHVVLASATVGPTDALAAAVGLDANALGRVNALTPWRDHSYAVAVDLRVDTRYQQRRRHFSRTAETVARLHAAATGAPVVFFPSYAYAETIERQLDTDGHVLRVALQPRLPDLAAQSAWVEQSLALADVLFLVLGSSFAEGIDMLGGRVTHAMVVGPALPEVNARQRARLTELERQGVSRDDAFDRVYRIPGLQKVNQGLGRLVRAPGQRTQVLLHCQRFIEPGFARLLAKDYQFGTHIPDDAALEEWLVTSA